MFAFPSAVNAGFIITPVFDSTITSDANKVAIESTINTAIAFYEATFSNPIDVTIDFSEMTSGLGESEFNLYSVNYSDYYNALASHATSANDYAALTQLGSAPSAGGPNPVTGTSQIYMKPATEAALGLTGRNVNGGSIYLNTDLTTPGTGGGGSYSLLAVTEHEIDEILGLGSTLGLSGTGLNSNQPSPEDFFRFDGSGNRSYTTSGSATAYFSIDGTTDLAQFNQNSSGDYGDWASTGTVRVQDAFGTPGSTPYLTLASPEVAALDVIGYTLATPEPSTVVLLGLGLIGAGLLKRRR